MTHQRTVLATAIVVLELEFVGPEQDGHSEGEPEHRQDEAIHCEVMALVHKVKGCRCHAQAKDNRNDIKKNSEHDIPHDQAGMCRLN